RGKPHGGGGGADLGGGGAELKSVEGEVLAREELARRLVQARDQRAELDTKRSAAAPILAAAHADAARVEASSAAARARADELAKVRDARAADLNYRQ